MVGAHLRAALRAGLKEEEFWRLTPYRLSERLDEARKLHLETCLLTGWFSERFAREERLQGPQTYIESMIERPDPKADAELAEAMARAEFHRMAASKGIEVEPAPDAA